jgi:tetratricopeptide (TPR) repeat protein
MRDLNLALSVSRRYLAILIAASLLGFASTVDAADPDPDFMQRMEVLLSESKAAEALREMRSRELQYAGSPRFDYLLGLAALDAQQPAEAVAPLERVLAVEPRFAGARMELARALYESGARDAARRQFEFLLEDNPPPPTRTVIERYLGAIANRAPLDASASRRSWFVDLGTGYDTNANGATNDTQFLGFTLNARNVETESAFAEIGTGLTWGRPLSPNTGVNAFGRIMHRANPDAGFVDQTIAYLGGSYLFKLGETRYTVGVNGFHGLLDGEEHQRSVNLELGVSRVFVDQWEFAGLLRAGRLDFLQDDLQILDVDRYLGGIALTRLNLRNGTARLGAAALVGRDDERRASSPYGNDKWGLRLYAGILLRPQSTLYGEVLYLDTQFDGVGFFGAQRRDEQSMAYVGVDFQNWPRIGWTVSPQLRFTDNRSNVSLFKYERFEAMVFVRRLFE